MRIGRWRTSGISTVKDYGLRWVSIDNSSEAKKALAQVGSDPRGIALMSGKAMGRALKLEGVPLKVAHVLKQEMLACGGDAAVHRDVITGGVAETDIMLVGSQRQLEHVANKLAAQPFGLKELAKQLKDVLARLEPPGIRVLDCRGKSITLGERTLVMGIVNITPDSFSDGGKFFDLDNAIAHARRLIDEGADILDIGAESTRPGYRELSPDEEWHRIEPVLPQLCGKVPVPVSLDTSKASVAARALELGVNIINDQWGLQRDPDMARVVGEYRVPVIVMHNQTGTEYRHVMGDMLAFLRRSIELAETAGLQGDQVIVDPGIGFGKTTAQNLEATARLVELKTLGRPILLGTSRKSMIGNTLNLPVDQRLEGTIATSVIGVAAGVDIIRVHDVLANRRAVLMADAILRGQRGHNYGGD